MKLNLKHVSKDLGRFVADQSPQILSILGVVGVGATAYLTHKATWNAQLKVVEVAHSGTWVEPPTARQKAELTWKLYIPAATAGVMTVGCIVAANRVQARRFAALAAAYGVISGDFDEFRERASEILGFKKTDELDQKIAEETVRGSSIVGGVLPDGKTWFYDHSTRDIFPSTIETVKAAVNKVNYACNNQRDMSLNDFYQELNLEPTSIGDILGWSSSHPCDVVFSPILTDTHGAVTAFKFTRNPIPNY